MPVRCVLMLCGLFPMVLAADIAAQAQVSPPIDPAPIAVRGDEPSQIAEWVAELDADRWETRKLATEALVRKGGTATIELLGQSLRGDCSAEVELRAFRILQQLAVQGQADDESAAYELLSALSELPDGTGRRALTVLNEVATTYQQRAIERLLALGATMEPDRANFAPFNGQQWGLALAVDDGWKGTAEDFAMVRRLVDVDQITLEGERFDDAYMEPLEQLQNLRHLRLLRTSVTDRGFAHLKECNQIEMIQLWYSPVSTESTDVLLNMNRLTYLEIYGTDLDRESMDKVRESIPGARIDFRRGGFLGVGQKMGADLRVEGCMINQPVKQSAAEKAGLEDGDVILKCDERPIANFEELQAAISEYRAGESVQIELLRGRERLTKKVMLDRRNE